MAHSIASTPNHSRFLLFSSSNSPALVDIDRPRRFLEIPTKARRNRASVARAMESSSGVDGAADSSKGETKGTKNNISPIRSSGAGVPLPNIPTWARWVVGSIFFLALPFYKRILRIEGEVEKDAETVVEIVEAVAEVTEKIASDVADALPGDGRLKPVALEIELVAEEVSKDAEKAEAMIHKVDEIIKEDIETMVERISEEEGVKDKQSQAKKEASASTDSSKAT